MVKVYNMKKSSLLTISCFIFFLFGITTNAQKVSNITYRQEQSNIIVSYDLETKTPCKVSLYVSTNGGVKWQGSLSKVTGDVGDKIISGRHDITWNVLEEFEELRGEKIMFQIRAIVDDIETVLIGNQEWTTKNLNVSKYRNGDIIPEVKDPKKWANLKTGAWCYYNNEPKNGAIYGKLYNWHAINDPRGLAPEGYHVPSENEWEELRSFLNIGYKGKNGATADLAGIKLSVNTEPPQWFISIHEKVNYLTSFDLYHMKNTSKFDSLFAGYRNQDGWSFSGIGEIVNYWSQEVSSFCILISGACAINKANDDYIETKKKYGHSIRLLKDQ
jgi:uncharacterized protein (TIGR02145 family)